MSVDAVDARTVVHSRWDTRYVDHASVAEFLHWAATFDDVYFVNNIELVRHARTVLKSRAALTLDVVQLDWMDNPMDVDEMKTSFPCDFDEDAPLCENSVQCVTGFRTCGLCPEEAITLANYHEELCDKGLPKMCAGPHCACGEPVAGCDVGPWSEWSTCPTQCGGGSQTRSRRVSRAAGLAPAACAYVATQNRSCNSQACAPTPCSVSEWASWGECRCDAPPYEKARLRMIVTPNSAGGVPCPVLEERVDCESDCAVCQVSPWSAWAPCSAPCGGGTMTRARHVVSHGLHCPTLSDESECNVQACPVCVLGAWSAWSACSVACGGGSQTRQRAVLHNDTGSVCPQSFERRTCNETACTGARRATKYLMSAQRH